MRELEVTAALPVSAPVALRALYDDAGTFFAGYHKKAHSDDTARCSPWEPATRTRTVSFCKRLDMPAALARVLGDITSLQVQDVQVLAETGHAGGHAVITSEPNVGVKALEKFRTRLTTTIEPGEQENACVLRTKVTVDAPVFGLQTLIERQMALVAAESLEVFNAYAVAQLSELASQPPPRRLALEPASPRASRAACVSPRAPRASAPPTTSPLPRAGSLKRRRSSMPEDAAAVAEAVEAAAAAKGEQAAAEVAAEAKAEAAGGLARSSSLRRRVAEPVRKC